MKIESSKQVETPWAPDEAKKCKYKKYSHPSWCWRPGRGIPRAPPSGNHSPRAPPRHWGVSGGRAPGQRSIFPTTRFRNSTCRTCSRTGPAAKPVKNSVISDHGSNVEGQECLSAYCHIPCCQRWHSDHVSTCPGTQTLTQHSDITSQLGNLRVILLTVPSNVHLLSQMNFCVAVRK